MGTAKSQKKQIPAHEFVERDLRKILTESRAAPHSSFLSEVEMANKFGVNVATARKAVERLVQEGLLYKVHRKGTFVAPKPRNRLILIITTNPNFSVVGKLTPVADQYPDMQWQELTVDSLRSYIDNVEYVFPRLEGVLLIRDFPRCIDIVRVLKKKGIPTFFYGSDIHLPMLGGCSVLLYSESRITRMAMDHLKAQGCKRIACVGSTRWPASKARMDHYHEWIKHNKFPDDPELLLDEPFSTDFRECYSAVLERLGSKTFGADGIYCTSNELACIVIQAACTLGIKIPSELAVVGVEDDESIALRIFPQITAVRIPFSEDIQESFKQLSALKGIPPKEDAQIWSTPFLIHRQSS